MRIVEVDTGKLELSELGELKNIVSRLVAKRLDGMVVYTLDESKRKERIAGKREMIVEVNQEADTLIITLGRKHR